MRAGVESSPPPSLQDRFPLGTVQAQLAPNSLQTGSRQDARWNRCLFFKGQTFSLAKRLFPERLVRAKHMHTTRSPYGSSGCSAGRCKERKAHTRARAHTHLANLTGERLSGSCLVF